MTAIRGNTSHPCGTEEVGRSVDATKAHLKLGRSARADVRLRGPQVSRIHAVIERTPQGFVLRNRSANGVRINGRRSNACGLDDKDVISIGPYRLLVEIFRGNQWTAYRDAGATQSTPDDMVTIAAPDRE